MPVVAFSVVWCADAGLIVASAPTAGLRFITGRRFAAQYFILTYGIIDRSAIANMMWIPRPRKPLR